MTAKRYDLIKKHFKVKSDEDLFDFYTCMDKFKECEYDGNKAIAEIKNVNDGIKYLEDAKKELSWIDDDYYKGNVESIEGKIEDCLREIDNIGSEICDLHEAYQHAQTWGDDWRETAISMLMYMLEHHPDEIDDMGVIKHSINENFLRSIETTNKFDL